MCACQIRDHLHTNNSSQVVDWDIYCALVLKNYFTLHILRCGKPWWGVAGRSQGTKQIQDLEFRISRAQKDKRVQNSLFQTCVDDILMSLILICILSFNGSTLQQNLEGSWTLCSDPFSIPPFASRGLFVNQALYQNSTREFDTEMEWMRFQELTFL